jgi:hypothetical protein
MLDVKSGEYVRDAVILIQNGKIADLGPRLDDTHGGEGDRRRHCDASSRIIDVHTRRV